MSDQRFAGFWDRDADDDEPVIRQAQEQANLGHGTEHTGKYSLQVEDEPELPVVIAEAPVQESFSGNAREEQVNIRSIGIDDLLLEVLERGGSDLHLIAGSRPKVRIHGDLEAMEEFPILSSMDIGNLVYDIMSDTQRATFEREHELDLAYSLPGRSRFRVNVYQQRYQIGSVMRVIPNRIKSLEELGMPEILASFAGLPRGLVLVTGPTGSGKSTTLAAILDLANRTRPHHIMTFEDPIEFVHQNKQAVINQREVGVDTASFQVALKHVLRQDPDIILVGEMRDYETISAAITAAETGHLVFGTLHTQSAADTISRVVDVFPAESQNQIQTQLAATLMGVVSQTLLRTIDGNGRVAAVEVLIATDAVRSNIRDGKPQTIAQSIETGSSLGMKLRDQHIKELIDQNKISLDEGLEHASNRDGLITSLGGNEQLTRIRRRQKEGDRGFTRGGLGGSR